MVIVFTAMSKIPSNEEVQPLPMSMLTLFHNNNKVSVKVKTSLPSLPMFPFFKRPLNLFIMHAKFELQNVISTSTAL